MKKTKLAHAVAMAITGTALSMGAVSSASAASTTMYNTAIRAGVDANSIPNRITGTDGWVYNGTGGTGNPTYPIANPGFVGIGGSNTVQQQTPFNYAGTSHLNWGASVTAVGDTATISKAAGTAAYPVVNDLEIDTGAGAWLDTGIDTLGNPTTNGPTGWKHQTDIGLIKNEGAQDLYVTLTPSVVSGGAPAFLGNFGITVFTGMDTNTGTYNHHGAWNCTGCTPARPFNASNPFGTTGVLYQTHSGTVDVNNPLTFFAAAGQVYSIYLGGAGVGRWNQNVADYSLQISTSAVPVPAAAWLFGGAVVSLVGTIRRKRVMPA